MRAERSPRLTPWQKPRVLAVSDRPDELVAIVETLDGEGCEVVRVPSGKEALRLLVETEVALVVLDAQLGDVDLPTVARVLREDARSAPPIILVTADRETPESIFEGFEKGSVDVLCKPVRSHVLGSKAHVFLALHRARTELAEELAAHDRTLTELDAFNYAVSHDLRSPLRHVAAFAKILSDDYATVLDVEGQRLLTRVVAGAHRMDQLISDLLRLARISRTRPAVEPIDLSVLVRQIVTEMRGADPERDLEVTVPDAMPSSGDEKLLTIALENLLRNAWKFTSKTEKPRIEVGFTHTPFTTIYFVKDNGAGFAPEHAEQLFAPFQRLHAGSDFEGTGIGLAIVQRIIHGHRGRIWAEAAPNQGATFFFTLGG